MGRLARKPNAPPAARRNSAPGLQRRRRTIRPGSSPGRTGLGVVSEDIQFGPRRLENPARFEAAHAFSAAVRQSATATIRRRQDPRPPRRPGAGSQRVARTIQRHDRNVRQSGQMKRTGIPPKDQAGSLEHRQQFPEA